MQVQAPRLLKRPAELDVLVLEGRAQDLDHAEPGPIVFSLEVPVPQHRYFSKYFGIAIALL